MTSQTPQDSAQPPLPSGLQTRLSHLFPGATVVAVRALGPDADPTEDESNKGIGYGRPLRIDLSHVDGRKQRIVFHTATANDFGHDRRSDRAAEMLLSYDTFHLIPRQARALDVGAICSDGGLTPLGNTGEFYLITEWAEGHLYAEDLRRIAHAGIAQPQDVDRARDLARYLAALHRHPGTHAGAYVRALRDLVGSGEGIAGIADGYPADTPGAPPERLHALQRACLDWRFRLHHHADRLRRTHGDFHPFNLLFDDRGELFVLDSSRGCEGDPADDVASLTINYLFFGVEQRATWAQGLGRLWHAFFETYVADAGDDNVFSALAPFYAWRALVVASPQWYPHMHAADRDRILRFAERALAAPRFDPRWGAEAMS